MSALTIAMTFDDRWLPHFATCATSIAASRGADDVRFVILRGPELSEPVVEQMTAFVRGLGMELDAVVIPQELLDGLPPTLLFSPMVWYRLLLPALLPDLDRVLALDADTLVLQSLRPLFDLDLGDHLLAAVASPVTDSEDYVRGLGLDPADHYFNAGVMVLNLAAMRAERLGPRAVELGHQRHTDLMFAEQDALNILGVHRWLPLHPRWNALSYLWLTPEKADGAYPDVEIASARHSPAIVHFEGFQTVKPWFYRSVHPLRFLYRELRATTPWPLLELERKSVGGAVLRRLPIRLQYAITRVKPRVKSLLRRRA